MKSNIIYLITFIFFLIPLNFKLILVNSENLIKFLKVKNYLEIYELLFYIKIVVTC